MQICCPDAKRYDINSSQTNSTNYFNKTNEQMVNRRWDRERERAGGGGGVSKNLFFLQD